MFTEPNFSYNGICGEDMYGLQLVRVNDSGLIEQNFGISRKTVTEKVKKRNKVYYYGTEDDVLTLPLEMYKETPFTYQERVTVTKWLFQNKYCEFESADYPLVFKCMPSGDAKFHNTGDGHGYIELTMECDAPFGYSPIETASFDLSDNTTTQIITLENKSNINEIYKPELQITMVGSTSVKFENLTDGGKIFEFTGLNNNEIIYINNSTEKIYSALNETRLNNLSDHRFFELVYGKNQIRVTGQIILQTRMQYPMMV